MRDHKSRARSALLTYFLSERPMDGMKKILYSSFLVLGLVGASLYSINLKNQNFQVQNSIEEVREGVNICFARLQQTYTSVYISPNLSYLAVDFLKATESCFAQALAVAIDARMQNSAEVEKQINRLGNYVRLFHAGVKNKSLFSKGKSDYSVANSRFIKLEETRDQILGGLDKLTSQNKKQDQKFTFALYALIAGALIGICGIIFFDQRMRNRLERYRQQIVDSLETSEDRKPDTTQAFYKAMKYFDVKLPNEISINPEDLTAKEVAVPEVAPEVQPENKVEVQVENPIMAKPVVKEEPKKEPVEEIINVTLGDILGQILMEYSPDILSQKISTKFNEFEEVAINNNSNRLYHLMKFIFGILVKSEFQGAPFIHLQVEKKNSPVIKIKTNSIFSQFENSTSQSLFTRATESFSDEFDLSIGEGSDGVNTISIKQKKRLVNVFRGTKKQFLEGRNNPRV
jgi:hypothetical protein